MGGGFIGGGGRARLSSKASKIHETSIDSERT